jgi:hypothetical protein
MPGTQLGGFKVECGLTIKEALATRVPCLQDSLKRIVAANPTPVLLWKTWYRPPLPRARSPEEARGAQVRARFSCAATISSLTSIAEHARTTRSRWVFIRSSSIVMTSSSGNSMYRRR